MNVQLEIYFSYVESLVQIFNQEDHQLEADGKTAPTVFVSPPLLR